MTGGARRNRILPRTRYQAPRVQPPSAPTGTGTPAPGLGQRLRVALAKTRPTTADTMFPTMIGNGPDEIDTDTTLRLGSLAEEWGLPADGTYTEDSPVVKRLLGTNKATGVKNGRIKESQSAASSAPTSLDREASQVTAYTQGARAKDDEHTPTAPGGSPRETRRQRPDLANTEDEVSPHQLYDQFDFDPEGDGEKWYALKNPFDAAQAGLASADAYAKTDQLYAGKVGNAHNNEADAFRHAYWNYLMTQKIGEEGAKKAADSYEIGNPNPDGERLMDLYNNQVGRELARDPKNKDRAPAEVVQEAIENGKLRLHPFSVSDHRHRPDDTK